MKARLIFLISAFAMIAASLAAAPTLNVIPGEQMRYRAAGSSVTANGPEWDIVISVDWDNSDTSSFRAWWHVEVNDLNTTTGETLNFTISGSEFSDQITPVWSIDGGATYSRIPSGQKHPSFTITTPPGVSSIRVARYFPYTMTHFEAFRSVVTANPLVTETVLGNTTQARPIYLWEITDTTTPATGKQRVWIHTAVHPSENTAYFTVEGLINWLLGGSPEAEIVLDNIIFDIVPMANPDGVYNGNYRTTSLSQNLENHWSSPYNSTIPEIVAMRTKIEEFMGTSVSPGANPIKLLLNMHSSHGVTYPFHFVHTAASTSTSVHNLELKWVDAFRNRSAFVNLGSNQSSSLSGRVYVESMMFDRYSSQPAWDDIVAITFEGTYQAGPTFGVPNTREDYVQVGEEMGFAIADFFEIDLDIESVNGWMLMD